MPETKIKNVVARRIGPTPGVVTNTRFVRCFWPQFDLPTKLFAEGSSGLVVIGPPTPRNIVFPADTEFLVHYPDAHYPAELAVMAGRSAGARFINLTDEEGDLWWDSYLRAVGNLSPTATTMQDRPDRHLLRLTDRGKRYVAELTPQEVTAIVEGRIDAAELKALKEFIDLKTGEVVHFESEPASSNAKTT